MLQSEWIHKFQRIIHSAFIFRVRKFRKNPFWTAWPFGAERPLKWMGGWGDLIPAPKIKFRRQRVNPEGEGTTTVVVVVQ